jgi:hypothetical protein
VTSQVSRVRSRWARTKTRRAQGFTLKVQSNLVVEAVEVKDKQGNFVQGLTAKDFVLTEDGAPQTIRYCEHAESVGNRQALACG